MFLFSLMVSLSLSFFLHMLFFQPFYLEHYEKRLVKIFQQVEENLYSADLTDIIMELDYSQQVDITIAERNLHYALQSRSNGSVTEHRLEHDYHNLILKERESLKNGYICITTSGESSPPRLVFVSQLSDGRYCILSHPWEPLASTMDAMTHFHFLVGAIASFLGIITTLFFSRQFTKPIIEISKVTEALSMLDFQQKITYESEDELGELAKSINILSNALEIHRNALKNEIEFQKVLSQNMSHELKTPISIMKGYVEGVTHGIVETEAEKAEYLQIVLEECDRMTSLINRMLHLSKLTSFQELGLDKTSFNGTILGESLQTHCFALLQKHQITLEIIPSDEILWGNLDLLVQALGNFVSNAVKYGDGVKLQFSISEEDNGHCFNVYNSGSTIQETDYKRIFNVFYMLDKARSRQLNSHGLGLAVCKTIAELHHGQTFCYEMDDGMVFVMKIPFKP